MSNKLRGFTLVELLISMFILLLLSAFAYRAVRLLTNQQHVLSEEAADLIKLQKLFLLWRRDTSTMRWSGSELNNISTSDEPDTFTLNDSSSGREISYHLSEKALYRELSGVSVFKDQPPTQTPLLLGVESFDVKIFERSTVDSADSNRWAKASVHSISLGESNIVYSFFPATSGEAKGELSGFSQSSQVLNGGLAAVNLSDQPIISGDNADIELPGNY